MRCLFVFCLSLIVFTKTIHGERIRGGGGERKRRVVVKEEDPPIENSMEMTKKKKKKEDDLMSLLEIEMNEKKRIQMHVKARAHAKKMGQRHLARMKGLGQSVIYPMHVEGPNGARIAPSLAGYGPPMMNPQMVSQPSSMGMGMYGPQQQYMAGGSFQYPQIMNPIYGPTYPYGGFGASPNVQQYMALSTPGTSGGPPPAAAF